MTMTLMIRLTIMTLSMMLMIIMILGITEIRVRNPNVKLMLKIKIKYRQDPYTPTHLALGEPIDGVERGIQQGRVGLSLGVEAGVRDECWQDGVSDVAVEGETHLGLGAIRLEKQKRRRCFNLCLEWLSDVQEICVL